MKVKKINGKIYGAELTATEKKALNMEIGRQIVDMDRKHALELEAMVLWELHSQLGFGEKRLKRFYDLFVPSLEDLLSRYEMGSEDTYWLCTKKLDDAGIDIEQWFNERGGVEKSVML